MKMLGAILILTGCLVGLFLAMKWQLTTSVDISPIIATAPLHGPTVAGREEVQIARAEPHATDLNAIVMRPLFSPDRRKFVPPPTPPPKPQVAQRIPTIAEPLPSPKVTKKAAPKFHLFGVSIAKTQSRVLISEGSADPAWISLGEKISDWTIEHIDANGTLIESSGERVRLNLYLPKEE